MASPKRPMAEGFAMTGIIVVTVPLIEWSDMKSTPFRNNGNLVRVHTIRNYTTNKIYSGFSVLSELNRTFMKNSTSPKVFMAFALITAIVRTSFAYLFIL